ncbi:MAG: UDP-N-acetylglucosamine--N-acetylmuramyl-(pentapeptide) pyrophosphoryl-undecaprenol N-acetylglucosamine transferase, partial [Bacteroidota bacterium]
SLRKAGKILKKHQPQIAIGVGGFASGPLLYKASGKGIPTLIQEQNSFPGITNRILSKKVNTICAGFDGLERWFDKNKIVLTGNPIRSTISDVSSVREESLKLHGFSSEKKTVFIMGGSLGARSLNQGVTKALDTWKTAGYQVIWQTGKSALPRLKKEVNLSNYPDLRMVDFIERMDLAYAAADVIVSRAGAMSIAELALVGKPAILVPSPNVSEDHQTKNAMSLTESGAAVLLKDSLAPDNLGREVLSLLKNGEKRADMANKMAALGKPKATAAVVNEIEKLIKK